MAGLEKKVKKAFIIPSFSWSNQEELEDDIRLLMG